MKKSIIPFAIRLWLIIIGFFIGYVLSTLIWTIDLFLWVAIAEIPIFLIAILYYTKRKCFRYWLPELFRTKEETKEKEE